MNTFLSKILSLILAPIIFIGGLGVPAPIIVSPQAPTQNVGATLPQATGVFETSLSSPITSTATSMTLTANLVRGGGSISGYVCFTVDEGAAQAEVMCGTVASTAVAAMTRGISYADGITSVTANKFAHRRGASVKITDFPLVQILKAQNNGDVTFPNALSYDSGVVPSTADQLADKGYVDGIAIAGSPDSTTTTKGIGKVSVAPVSPTSPIFVGDNDGRVPTQGENDAQVGNNTDIAVGTGNKFITQTGLQHNAEKYAADTSASSTAYVVTLAPVPTSLTAGMIVYAKIINANTTTTPTLNINSLGAKTIVKYTNTALATGDIGANSLNTFIYDGTNMVLQNPTSSNPTNIQAFLANGTWTKPAGATSNSLVIVQAWGGGGGGGGASAGVDGKGGGGGAYIMYTFYAGQLTSTVTVTIGIGGSAGTSGGGNGGTPVDTSFGAFLIAGSGGGGGGAGGSAGTAGLSDFYLGNGGIITTNAGAAIYGGGAGGNTGAGGTSKYAGAGGAGVTQGAGNPGVFPSGGGSAGNRDGTGTASAGSAGASGQLIVTTIL